MNKKEQFKAFLFPLFIIYVLGFVSIFCLLLTFFSSKVLRSHPSNLIMCCCIAELAFTYSIIMLYWQAFTILDIEGLNTFYPTFEIIEICTFGAIRMGDATFAYLFDLMLWFPLITAHIYYTCLSIDIILIIRNPFYPPERRDKKYHFAALTIPTITAITSTFMY